MSIVHSHDSKSELAALESAVASARSGFACIFSTADEYEHALISARRAEGRYGSSFDWQPVILGGCALVLAAILFSAF